MLIRQLSYFVTLARERHFARAADACNIAQPTLSAAIRKLEEDLEAQLVVRSHKFVGLTPEGEKLLVWGRQILADYGSLREDLTGLRSGLTGTLRLGVIPAAMPAIALLSARFLACHPDAKIEILSLTSRAIAQGLDAFEIDGGLTYLDNEPIEHVRRLPLYRERFIFIAGRNHPLASRERLTWREAAGSRLCLLSEDMQNRRIINRLADSVGVAIAPTVVSNSFLALCSHLRQGGWASIVPDSFLYLFGAAADLAAVRLVEPEQSQTIGLVLSDREPSSAMANALAASLAGMDFAAELRDGIGASPSTPSIKPSKTFIGFDHPAAQSSNRSTRHEAESKPSNSRTRKREPASITSGIGSAK
ncbi:LysR family transcriptional regulator [Bosea sp. BK604]|uniref:LysR family transcriptional regulator n=1 Tax=Bosea sp. BK604 TaxID=2512180 RepID=UPI001050E369|nr:LysR family transcriptional regulator [Bosea sp. BK604]TCR66564.1 DNA-binding transcriptional LysR family regulator [Bosea sp. BK604]